MLWVILLWSIFAIWLSTKKLWSDFLNKAFALNKKSLLFIILFFLAGCLSLVTHNLDRQNLGQFVVLILQPMSIFFVGRYLTGKFPHTKYYILNTCYFILAITGLYALVQYFTLLGLPSAWWGNSVEPKRALSFFVHPNFYALWCAPLLAFLIPDVAASLKAKSYNPKALLWLIGAAGLFLSLSRAGWLGLAVAMLIYLIIAADKKIRWSVFTAAIVVFLIILAIPNFRYRILLPFLGEKSTVSRFSLWNTGWKGVKESPITGLGLTGFSRQWSTLNTDPGLTDTHNFPHNIFLDMWVELGLLGLLSFVCLVAVYIYNGLRNRQDLIKLGVSLFLIALIVQGQIDNPYFKNDLAMVFWIILSFV